MTKFTDGPAAGLVLSLRRAPIFIRVVVDQRGEMDALDQLDDTAKPGEKIYAYELAEKSPGHVHLNRGGGKSGYYAMATYRFLPEQPRDDEMRTTDAWRAWTNARGPAAKARLEAPAQIGTDDVKDGDA